MCVRVRVRVRVFHCDPIRTEHMFVFCNLELRQNSGRAKLSSAPFPKLVVFAAVAVFLVCFVIVVVSGYLHLYFYSFLLQAGNTNHLAAWRILSNSFTPEFLTWTLPSRNLYKSIVANRGFSQNHNLMANCRSR